MRRPNEQYLPKPQNKQTNKQTDSMTLSDISEQKESSYFNSHPKRRVAFFRVMLVTLEKQLFVFAVSQMACWGIGPWPCMDNGAYYWSGPCSEGMLFPSVLPSFLPCYRMIFSTLPHNVIAPANPHSSAGF